MASVTRLTADGEQIAQASSPSRGWACPTLRTDADVRRARDVLMKVGKTFGWNNYDLGLIFQLTPNHVHKRLLVVGKVGHFLSRLNSRRGL